MPTFSPIRNDDLGSDIEPAAIISSSDDDDAAFTSDEDGRWSYSVNSLNNIIMRPKDGDYSQFKRRLDSDLRVGSAYHLGSHTRPFQAVPGHCSTASCIIGGMRSKLFSAASRAFTRHPLNLILAREQGDIGPASKARRLRYQATRWLVDGHPRFDGLQTYGNRSVGAVNTDPQTFQELVQGSFWAVSRLHLEHRFRCHRGCVNALSFNALGNRVASGSDDTKVVVTNWISREQVAKYSTGHSMNIFHVKFVPETNDTQIVSCACDSEVRLAQLASDGSLVGPTRLLVSHNRACHKLALPKGEPHIVLSAGADGQVFSIDLRESRARNILWLPFSEFFCISSNPVKPYEFVVCGRSEAIIRTYDRRRMNPRDVSRGFLHCYGAEHLRPVDRSARDPTLSSSSGLDGTSRASGGLEDRMAFDPADEGGGHEPYSDFFTSVSPSVERHVRAVLRNLRNQSRLTLQLQGRFGAPDWSNLPYGLEPSKYSVTAAMYSNQGDVILASYNDEDIYLFDVNKPSAPYLHKYSGHRNMQTIVSATFFGPNSEYIISGSDDGFFYIWDRESEGIVQWLHADVEGAVNVIESHPSLPILASAGLDFDFKIWTPNRPLSENDGLNHPKYTFGRVPLNIRYLRSSRLAQVVFPTSDHLSVNASSPSIGRNNDEHSSLTTTQETISVEGCEKAPMTTDVDLAESNLPTASAPSSSFTPQGRMVRKRRRYHSSTSDVAHTLGVTDSERETSMEFHSDDERAADRFGENDSYRACKHRRRRSLSPTTSCRQRSLNPTSQPRVCNGVPHSELECNDHCCQTNNASQLRVPQNLIPFSEQDLALRVAQNWINRTCELRQIDSLDEADSQILSALETVAHLHAREARNDGNSHESDETQDTNDSTDESGIMGSFLFLRRPNCPVERSEESLTTRDRGEPLETNTNSTSDSDSSTSDSSSESTGDVGNDFDSFGSLMSSSTSSTESSESDETTT